MLKLAFYKDKGNLMNWAIRKITRSPYSHVELVFSDWISISSSNREGGVREKDIPFSDGKWKLVPLPQFSAQEPAIRAWAESQIGKKYDWPGIFGFIFKDVHAEQNEYFCSEFCARALGVPPELAAHMSPADLFYAAPQLTPKQYTDAA